MESRYPKARGHLRFDLAPLPDLLRDIVATPPVCIHHRVPHRPQSNRDFLKEQKEPTSRQSPLVPDPRESHATIPSAPPPSGHYAEHISESFDPPTDRGTAPPFGG